MIELDRPSQIWRELQIQARSSKKSAHARAAPSCTKHPQMPQIKGFDSYGVLTISWNIGMLPIEDISRLIGSSSRRLQSKYMIDIKV